MLFASRSLATFEESDTKPTGRKWYDCAECHQEQEDHQLLQTFDMVGTRAVTVGHGLPTTNARHRRLHARNAKSASGKILKNSRMRKK